MGNMQKVKYIAPFLLVSLMIAGCSNDAATENKVDTEKLVSKTISYTNDDFYTPWQGSNFTKISLNGSSASADGSGGVVIEESAIQIRTSGVYVIEGTLTDGQIIIDAEDQGTVRLVLNGANITSTTSAAIYVKQADKTVLSLEEGSENVLTDAENYTLAEDSDEPSATIFSKDDLTINGTGSLTVNGHYNDGIVGRDNVIVTGGHITVSAKDDGIVGRDCFALHDGTINIQSGGDGIKSTNDEDADRGNIVLENGTLTITSEGDGIQSVKDLLVIDGQYNIVAGGGSPETVETTDLGMGGFGAPPNQTNDVQAGGQANEEQGELGQTRPERPSERPEDFDPTQMPQQGMGTPPSENGQKPENFDPTEQPKNEMTPPNGDSPVGEEENNSTNEEDQTPSTKGIKAESAISIEGGTFTIDANDDGLHSNGNITVNAGDITINTGDDGVHADQDVVITNGHILIEKSYEGIEGTNITIHDGNVHIQAADDGVNINGGSSNMRIPGENESSSSESDNDSLLLIEGGYIYVDAAGDGLDSNSNIKMTGGKVIVYGPTNSGNGALDYDGTFEIDGGTLIAAGSSGMAMGVSDTSSQHTLLMTFTNTLEAGTTVYIESEDGEQVMAVAPEKKYQTIVVSSPDLQKDASYKLSFGGTFTGEAVDGLYSKTTIENVDGSVEFTLGNMMTYLNEDGVTEGSNGMGMPGGGRGGMPGGRGEGRPQQPSNEGSESNVSGDKTL